MFIVSFFSIFISFSHKISSISSQSLSSSSQSSIVLDHIHSHINFIVMNSNFVNLMDSPNFLFHSNTKLTQLTEMQFYRSIVRWSILLFLYFCVYLYRNLFCICHFAIHFGWHFNSFFSKFATFSSARCFISFFLLLQICKWSTFLFACSITVLCSRFDGNMRKVSNYYTRWYTL